MPGMRTIKSGTLNSIRRTSTTVGGAAWTRDKYGTQDPKWDGGGGFAICDQGTS